MERRTVLKAGVWSVPVIAAAVAVPAHAASIAAQQVVLTNKTAGVGGKTNTIFVNYKAKATEGRTGAVTVLVKGERDGQTLFEDLHEWAALTHRGDTTPLIDLEFPGIAKGSPVTVTVIVTCGGIYQDGYVKNVETPSWWT